MPAKRELNYDEIVRLRDEEGLSFEAIAQRVDSGKGAVYRAYGRAKGTYSDAKPKNKKRVRACTQRTQQERVRAYTMCTPEEIRQLREVLTWWRKRQQQQGCTEGTRDRVPRTFRVRADLLESLESYADQEGVSSGEAINRIIEAGLKALT